jgi:hypothetical protein
MLGLAAAPLRRTNGIPTRKENIMVQRTTRPKLSEKGLLTTP